MLIAIEHDFFNDLSLESIVLLDTLFVCFNFNDLVLDFLLL